MKAAGYFFILLATAALAWDASIVMAGYGAKGFSGILHIWQMLDQASFEVLEHLVIANAGYDFWKYVALPFMSLPAVAMFGLSGLFMLRGHSREIKARAPSAMEMEMVRQGLNPRRVRRR